MRLALPNAPHSLPPPASALSVEPSGVTRAMSGESLASACTLWPSEMGLVNAVDLPVRGWFGGVGGREALRRAAAHRTGAARAQP